MPKRVIHKFKIGDGSEPLPPQMPKGSKILTTGVIDNEAYIWAMVDPDAEKVGRHVFFVPTGQPFNTADEGCMPEVVGTFQVEDALGLGNPFVGHVLDYGEENA